MTPMWQILVIIFATCNPNRCLPYDMVCTKRGNTGRCYMTINLYMLCRGCWGGNSSCCLCPFLVRRGRYVRVARRKTSWQHLAGDVMPPQRQGACAFSFAYKAYKCVGYQWLSGVCWYGSWPSGLPSFPANPLPVHFVACVSGCSWGSKISLHQYSAINRLTV